MSVERRIEPYRAYQFGIIRQIPEMTHEFRGTDHSKMRFYLLLA